MLSSHIGIIAFEMNSHSFLRVFLVETSKNKNLVIPISIVIEFKSADGLFDLLFTKKHVLSLYVN